jgi:hypothetical protein
VKAGNGRDLEVRKGLIGGEDLILSPPDSLQDGQKVNAVSEAKTPENPS